MTALPSKPDATVANSKPSTSAENSAPAQQERDDVGRVGIRLSFVLISLVLVGSGVLQLAGEHLFPPSFDPAIVAANFLADIRAMLAILAGLLVLNLAAMIK